eukprot:15366866-Ditylum_brightwellii.AAC.1
MKGDDIASIHVINKCGEAVKGMSLNAIIQELPNVGCYDHTYAYYMSSICDKHVAKELLDKTGFLEAPNNFNPNSVPFTPNERNVGRSYPGAMQKYMDHKQDMV